MVSTPIVSSPSHGIDCVFGFSSENQVLRQNELSTSLFEASTDPVASSVAPDEFGVIDDLGSSVGCDSVGGGRAGSSNEEKEEIIFLPLSATESGHNGDPIIRFSLSQKDFTAEDPTSKNVERYCCNSSWKSFHSPTLASNILREKKTKRVRERESSKGCRLEYCFGHSLKIRILLSLLFSVNTDTVQQICPEATKLWVRPFYSSFIEIFSCQLIKYVSCRD